jgi:hypothetical protein
MTHLQFFLGGGVTLYSSFIPTSSGREKNVLSDIDDMETSGKHLYVAAYKSIAEMTPFGHVKRRPFVFNQDIELYKPFKQCHLFAAKLHRVPVRFHCLRCCCCLLVLPVEQE